MPELVPYHLTFRSGLHLGAHGENPHKVSVSLPSDSLFAALLDVFGRAGGDPQSFAAPFDAESPDPPLLLSSAFPFAGGVRFYPLPVDRRRLFSPEAAQKAGKLLKRIQFLSEGLFRLALQGQRLDDWLFPPDEAGEPRAGLALQDGALWMARDEVQRLPEGFRKAVKLHALRHHPVFSLAQTPRVTIDRITSASNIFQAGRVTFAQGCGLWFGVAWRQPDRPVAGQEGPTYRQAFSRALDLLQHDGLGGERSAGYGAFGFTEGQAISLPEPLPGAAAFLLSRYHPRPAELPAALSVPGAAYQLVFVGGWLRTPSGPAQRRKRLALLAEGSLAAPPAYPAGDLVDVRPEYGGAPSVPHPVYRSGLALAVGWPAEFSQEAKHA